MMDVTAKDALRALKKFKRLAKQDLLASELMAEPQFWRQQAEARRATYDVLMQLVEDEGVEAARRYAVDELAALPLLRSTGSDDAEGARDGNVTAAGKGKRQALEMFVSLLGSGDKRAAMPSA